MMNEAGEEIFGCLEIMAEGASCCGSCHSDSEDGYSELLEFHLPDGTMVYVCCALAEYVRAKLGGTH